MIRRSCSVSATSVLYRLPSEDNIFSCTILSYNSTAPSFFSFRFKSLQYRRGFSVPVKTEITSTMEKYHSSVSSSHAVRIVLFSKSCNLSFSMNPFLSSSGLRCMAFTFPFVGRVSAIPYPACSGPPAFYAPLASTGQAPAFPARSPCPAYSASSLQADFLPPESFTPEYSVPGSFQASLQSYSAGHTRIQPPSPSHLLPAFPLQSFPAPPL